MIFKGTNRDIHEAQAENEYDTVNAWVGLQSDEGTKMEVDQRIQRWPGELHSNVDF